MYLYFISISRIIYKILSHRFPIIQETNVTIHDANFSNTLLRKIPGAQLKKLPGLNVLDVSNNRFFTIQAAADTITTLTELHISNNRIFYLDGLPFSHMTDLIFLNLSANLIMKIKDNDFLGLESLKYLYMDWNVILEISPHAFQPLRNLEILKMNRNGLRTIQNGTFSNLTNLIYLSLSYNGILQLTDFALPMPSLKTLKVNSNQLKTIEPKAFAAMGKSMKSLSLENNYIKYLEKDAFENLTALKFLNLYHNFIKYIPANFLQESKNLKVLVLGFNLISTLGIPQKFFQLFPQLKSLQMGSNPLTEVPNIHGLKKLKYLELMNTAISQIWPCEFSEQLNSGKDFYLLLAETPFKCDCQIRWLKEWWESDLLHEADLLNGTKIKWRCEYPLHMRGKLFDDIRGEELTCEGEGEIPHWCNPHASHVSKPTLQVHIEEYTARSLAISWKLALQTFEMLNKVEISWLEIGNNNGSYIINSTVWISATSSHYTITNLQPETHYKVCVTLYTLLHNQKHFLAAKCVNNVQTNAELLPTVAAAHSDAKMGQLPKIIGPTFALTILLCIGVALTTYCIWKQRKLKRQQGGRMTGTNLSVIRGIKNPVYEIEEADKEISGASANEDNINIEINEENEENEDTDESGHKYRKLNGDTSAQDTSI